MPKFVVSLCFFVFALAALPAAGQTASATARIGAGQTVQVRATLGADGVLLEFLLPDGRSQSFPQLGQALVPLDGRSGGAGLIARDLNGDGVDEVVLRGSVPPDRGAMLAFRWSANAAEFVPITFTDDRDRTNPFAVVDAKEPVVFHPGAIEVQFETTRPDGRKSNHVARYRWNGQGFTQSADN